MISCRLVAAPLLAIAMGVPAAGGVSLLSQVRTGYARLNATATSPLIERSSEFAGVGFRADTLTASTCIPSWSGQSCESASTSVVQRSSITAGAIRTYVSISQNPGSGLYGPTAGGQGLARLTVRIRVDAPTEFRATLGRAGQAFGFSGLAGEITGLTPGTVSFPFASMSDVSGELPAGDYSVSITSELETFAFNTYTVNLAFAERGQTGACCTGSACHAATLAQCAGPGMAFGGGGTSCGFPGNAAMPCCIADFDHSNLISTIDLLGFLTAFFADDGRADINGGGTSVQDLFDFLQAYFAGGC